VAIVVDASVGLKWVLYPDSLRRGKRVLPSRAKWIRLVDMIRAGFLSAADRAVLIALVKNGSVAHRLARRTNAILLLNDGWSCAEVAKALYVDDDTVRDWHKLYSADGVEGLKRHEAGGSSSHLSAAQEEALQAWVAGTLPRSTRHVGAYIAQEFGVIYESRAGLIALLHGWGSNTPSLKRLDASLIRKSKRRSSQPMRSL
jgi:transposase